MAQMMTYLKETITVDVYNDGKQGKLNDQVSFIDDYYYSLDWYVLISDFVFIIQKWVASFRIMLNNLLIAMNNYFPINSFLTEDAYIYIYIYIYISLYIM